VVLHLPGGEEFGQGLVELPACRWEDRGNQVDEELDARLARGWGGASGAVIGDVPDDPTCRQTTVPVSSHAARNGSQ